MSSGFYKGAEGFFHRLHPVTRILAMLLAFVAALILEHPLYMGGLILLFGLASLGTGVLSNLWRVAFILVLVAFASFAIWTFAYPGQTPVFSLGPLEATREGMLYGAGMGLRLDLMVFAGLIFLTVTPVEAFTYGLTRMGVPFTVSFALSLSFRLMPLFSDTIRTIIDAQRARGLDPNKGGPVKRMRGYVPLLVPVFSSALRRTDQLAIALESKGFGGGKRGSYSSYPAGAGDVLTIVAMLVLIALLLFARLRGMGMISQ